METLDMWGTTLRSATESLWTKVAEFLPNLVAAIFILIIGYVIARIVRAIVSKLFNLAGLDTLSESAGMAATLDRANISAPLSDIVAGIVFWIVLLLFVVSAAEAVGLVQMAAVLNDIILYLPRVLGAIAILLGGLYLAGIARDLVSNAADGIGIEYSAALGSVIYGVLAVIVLSLAIGQLNLETEILTEVISILLLSLGLATAIAFGIGARTIAGNIIAGTYVKELYRDDDQISIEGVEGRIIAFGSVKTVIQTKHGEVSIANALLVEQNVTLTQTDELE